MKWLALCIGMLAMSGCATQPEQEQSQAVDLSAGVPLGLAWMPSSNDVVVSVGGIEHALLPAAPNAPTAHASRATPTQADSNDAAQPLQPRARGQRRDEQTMRDTVPSSMPRRHLHIEVGDACPIVE